MTFELGEVIARIGGDGGGGGGPLPRQYVYDLDGQTIPVHETLDRKIDGAPGDTVVATLEWEGPDTGELAVYLMGSFPGVDGYQAIGIGTAYMGESGAMNPVSIVGSAGATETLGVSIMALVGGYTATRLTVTVIPKIEGAQ